MQRALEVDKEVIKSASVVDGVLDPASKREGVAIVSGLSAPAILDIVEGHHHCDVQSPVIAG